MAVITFIFFAGLLFGPWIYARVVEGRRRRDCEDLQKQIAAMGKTLDFVQGEVKNLRRDALSGQQAPGTGGSASTSLHVNLTREAAAAPPKHDQAAASTSVLAPTPPFVDSEKIEHRASLEAPSIPLSRTSSPITPVPMTERRAAVEPAQPQQPASAASPTPPAVTVAKIESAVISAGSVNPTRQASPPDSSPTQTALRPVEARSAARTGTPAGTAAYRQAHAQPYAPVQPAPPKSRKFSVALEEAVGTNWLPKLGVVILFIGLTLFIASQWEHIPPVGRIAMFYLIGGAMLGLGIWLEKKERYLVLGRALIGFGWAVTFFTTYAMHHIAAARVIRSLELDLFLMLIVAGAMVWHTLRYDSQAVTGLAFLLGFFSVTQSHESAYSLGAGLILAAGMTVIVLQRKWYVLEIFGILASFLNHFYWLYPILEPMQRMHGHNIQFPEYPVSVAVSSLYWGIFRTSYVVRKVDTRDQESFSTTAALLNTFLLLGILKYQSLHKELAFFALLALGALELALGQLPRLKQNRRMAFLVLSTIGACLMVGAVPFRYSGSPRALLWLIGVQAFLFVGIFADEVLFLRFGMLTGLLVAVYEVVTQGFPFIVAMVANENPIKKIDPQLSLAFAFTAAVFYFNAHWVRSRWAKLFNSPFERNMLTALSYSGGLTALFAVYMYFPAPWASSAVAVTMLGLAFIGKQFEIKPLLIQSHVFAVIAVGDVFFTNADQRTSVRITSFVAVAGLLYASSYFVRLAKQASASTIAAGYTWAGSFLLAGLAWYQAPGWKTAIAWIVLAVALGLIGTVLKLKELNWQALALTVASFVAAVITNLETTSTFAGTHVSIRLLSTCFVAICMYLLARWSPREDWRPLYSWAGSILLTALAYKESPEAWIPVLWIALALALTFAGRQLQQRHLLWQSHILGVLAFARVLAVNFTEPFRHTTGQLLSVMAVVTAMYALAKLMDVDGLVESARIPQAYSWAASLLLTWLMWYQLPSINVAIAWALFGVVAFEIGTNIHSVSLRAQGYVGLAASFVRIFFANLNVEGKPGELSPRVYSVLPLVLMYFYVYWRIQAQPDANQERRVKTATLFAYIGTLTIASMMRFELGPDWVIAAWSILALALIVVAWQSRQIVFLLQALLLQVPITFRAVTHNLYSGASLGGVTNNAFTAVGVSVALLLSCLPVAFILRKHQIEHASLSSSKFQAWLVPLVRRPEQICFFVPVSLLTALLAWKIRSGVLTLSWGVEGVLIFGLALLAGERSFRLTGLGLLIVCVLKILAMDVWNLNEPRDRYLTLIGVGALLLLVSFLYSKYRERVREYL